jgi:hypothetical protein
MLYNFVWPWPKHFFIGRPGNPVSWRLNVGFKDKEIIIRRSRKWDREIFGGENEAPKLMEKMDAMMEERVMPAIDPTWLRGRTGYILMDANWDLDFKAMVDATELVRKQNAAFTDFEKAVIVWGGVELGWLSWDVHKLDDGSEEESRKKLIAFKVGPNPFSSTCIHPRHYSLNWMLTSCKDILTKMGKESLFFRWIELIQFESTQPGGFGPEKQQQAMEKAKAMFEADGVDFDAFWAQVGGWEDLPGM